MVLAWLSAAWLGGTAASATLGRGAWPLALAIGAVAATAFVVRRERRALVYALALPALFLAAGARYEAMRPHVAPGDAARFNDDGVAMRIRAVLRDDPDAGDTSQRFAASVRAVQIEGAWRPASGGVLVWTDLLPRYRSGDVLELEGELESPPRLDGFDYAAYLARRGIASTMSYPLAHSVGHEDDGIVHATVLRVRRSYRGRSALLAPNSVAIAIQIIDIWTYDPHSPRVIRPIT